VTEIDKTTRDPNGQTPESQIRRLSAHVCTRIGLIDGRDHTIASIVTALGAGLLTGLLILTECLSYAVLIFGELPRDLHGIDALGLGLGSMLSAAIIATLYCSAWGSRPPSTGGPDAALVGIMSVATTKVGAAVSASGIQASSLVPHFLFLFVLTSLACGVTLLALSRFGASRAAHFIPYPVIAGFLVASGVLLLYGGACVVIGRTVSPDMLWDLSDTDRTRRLAAALFCAVALWLASARGRRSSLVPVTALVCALVLVATIEGLVPGHLQKGWFLPTNVSPQIWSPLQMDQVRQLDWPALFKAAPEIVAIVMVLIVAMIAKLSAFEALDGQAGNVSVDMRTLGYANLMGVGFGASPMNLSGPGVRTVLTAAGGTRLSGIIIAIVCAVMFVVGDHALSSIPAPLVAGFLMFSGMSLLQGALMRPIRGRRALDLSVIVVVALACLNFGYLTGLGLGVVIACVMFAVSYSRIGLIRRHVTRANLSSDVDYGSELNSTLRKHGHAIHVYWLSGYMFFGSADAAFTQIRISCQEAPEDKPVRYVVFDCSRITGADASAIMSLQKLKAFATNHDVTLVFCALSKTLANTLTRDQLIGGASPHQVFPTRQQGLEWCEQELLEIVSPSVGDVTSQVPTAIETTFIDWLCAELQQKADRDTLMMYFKRRYLTGPMVLYEQGDPATHLDLIVAGQATVSYRKADGQGTRLRRMRQRTVVGEMGFFRSGVRTATVSLEEPALFYSLTSADYQRMKSDHPALATAFTIFIIRTLAERLEFANTEVAALT
jgi:sulfate permease, SulP family